MTSSFVPRSVLVVGGSSLLGREVAQDYASDGWLAILAGRDASELQTVASDVAIRTGATVRTMRIDLADPVSIDKAAAEVMRDGIPQVIIFVAGLIDGFADAPHDAAIANNLLMVNYLGPTRFVGRLLPALKTARGAAIAFVSSVAGERGRRTNFVYGAAKAALNTYCQGLRAMLAPYRVSVLTVKLGYMDTRLAYGVVPAVLTCSPRFAARVIRRAIDRRRMVIYVPGIWRLTSLAVRLIPERLFIRLPLP